MSLLVYPVFEKTLSFKPETTGEFLGRYLNELEELALKLKVKPLSYFDSLSHNEALQKAFENYDGETDPQDIIDSIPHKDIWFPAQEGLKTLNAFSTYLKKNPGEDKNFTDAVLNELADVKKALELASQKGLKFQIKMS